MCNILYIQRHHIINSWDKIGSDKGDDIIMIYSEHLYSRRKKTVKKPVIAA